LLICSLFSVHPHDSLAKTKYDSKQQAFLTFEDKITAMVSLNAKQLDMLDKLDKLNEQMDKKSLYNIVVSTKRAFAESSHNFAKLEIPSILPENIRESLKIIKSNFSYGFKALDESMTYYAKYLDTEDPVLYWKSVKKREKGITYINGGFTSLTTARMQLILPEYKEIQNTAWEMIKLYLFKLQRA
jgi:hypothetical protein